MITGVEQILLVVMVFLIMLGMGASLTFNDFRLAFKRPSGLFVGAISQFGFMPLIALGLAFLFYLNPLVAIGLLIMGATPGGTTSNIFTYFSKGNLALSVLMTITSTLCAIIMMPLLLSTYGSLYNTTDFVIPLTNIISTLFVLIIPVLLGMFIRKWDSNIGGLLELTGSLLGVVVIFFLIGTWVPRNFDLLMSTPIEIYIASILLGLVGILAGYVFSKLIKNNNPNCRTVAIETGVQNGPLAITIILLSFSAEISNQVLIVPILYSIFIVLTASLVTLYFRRLAKKEEQKPANLL